MASPLSCWPKTFSPYSLRSSCHWQGSSRRARNSPASALSWPVRSDRLQERFWYGVGRWIGPERLKIFSRRHGRWLTLSPADIDRASAWFARRGWAAVLVGRLVPGVRTLISVPAGVAGMPLGPFLLTTAVGTLLWTGLFATAGYVLAEGYRDVAGWIGPAGNAVLILALGGYGYRVITFEKPTREVP